MVLYSVSNNNSSIKTYKYLSLYLIVIYIAFWAQQIGDRVFNNKFYSDKFISDYFKIGIWFSFLFLMANGEKAFENIGVTMSFIILPVLAFLQPYLYKSVKNSEEYLIFNFVDMNL